MIFIVYEDKWICKKIIEDWKFYNPGKYTNDIKKATKIWLFNSYLYKKIKTKDIPVITTIHHIVENKLNKEEFKKIDEITTYYHSISKHTTDLLNKYTEKSIIECCIPIKPELKFIEGREELRKQLGLNDYYLIGSFQRDTEKNLNPKLEKGPDIFVEILKKYYADKNICVILTGYNRQYIIKKLEENNIKYFYKENVELNELNKLYNLLDLYIISSRVEGGPRSLFDCALLKVPIVSTDVGFASKILSKKSLFMDIDNYGKAEPDIEEAFRNVLIYLSSVYMIEFNKKIGFI